MIQGCVLRPTIHSQDSAVLSAATNHQGCYIVLRGKHLLYYALLTTPAAEKRRIGFHENKRCMGQTAFRLWFFHFLTQDVYDGKKHVWGLYGAFSQ